MPVSGIAQPFALQVRSQALRMQMDIMKLRQAAPALLVIFVSILLMQLRPSFGVWCCALVLPLIVGASLFVERFWSETKAQFAVIAAAFSTVPVVHHAWVFNVEGNTIMAWSLLFALVPALLIVAVATRAPLVRQLRTRRAAFAVIAAASAFCYGMGAAYFANSFFDHGRVQRYDATVKARVVRRHFGFLFKQYDLNVSPWGNHRTVDSITVGPDVIAALSVGDHVYIEQSPGTLGIPWVRVAAP